MRTVHYNLKLSCVDNILEFILASVQSFCFAHVLMLLAIFKVNVRIMEHLSVVSSV